MADLTTKQVLQKLGKDILNWVKTNCVDNLVSTSKNLPLSANQGRVLKEGQDAINQSLESLFKIVQIRINGEGKLYSHINIDANYKLINIVIYYEGSDNGKYRVESIQQATDTTYILYLSDILSKDSYINAYGVLIH